MSPESPQPRREIRRDEDARLMVRARLAEYVLPVLAAGLLIALLILAVVSVGVLKNQGRITDTQSNLRKAVRGSCERLQLARDDLNVQAWVQYSVIEATTSSQPDPKEVQRLLGMVDKDTRNLLVALLEPGAKSAPLYPRILANTLYSPPTNCDTAVANPEKYRTPEAVPFRVVWRCFEPETVKGRRPVPMIDRHGKATCRKP